MGFVHGEYKAPGGKLVVVDVGVAGGRLRDVHVSGDFFLEPSEVLERLDAALEGVAVSADSEQLTAVVAAVLDRSVVMVGISPQAVAIAVRRALTHASSWSDYGWQLVHLDAQPPVLHVALDEVLVGEVAAGRRPPTLRIWEFSSPAVVIGTFQSLRNEVDAEAAGRLGVSVVRRITGGGAMFAEPGKAITYSIYAPAALVAGMSYAESYPFLDGWVVRALSERLGLEASYQPINDIVSAAGKIGGAAQTRLRDGTVLHHAMMAYDMDGAKLTQVLRVGREKLSDKGVASADKRVSPVRRLTDRSRAEVLAAMVASFAAQCDLVEGGLSERELALAGELVRAKFATPEWTARVP